MIKPGMIIGDRYEIIDKVGSGGMADVYKALCHKLNRYVAIKILKQEFSSDDSFVEKFRAEAQSAAGLSHPNIVNVYDVGEENGIYYIVMELIEGITLKNFIERKGRLDIREATGIAIQIAQGLEAAHANNIIHRDIKPQNIIISREGKVKVADFGIAKAASSNTLTSSAMGSVHYISPEQARGGYSDEKSDIYSLGITIYEMISGRVPFEGDNAVSIALSHIQEEARPLGDIIPGIPISIDKIVQKCLQKKAERRYSSVVELIEDLKHSLIEPDVDFVVIPDVLNNSPTIALSQNDVNAIRNGAMQTEMNNAAAMMNNMNNMNNGMQQNRGYDEYNNFNNQQMYGESPNIQDFNQYDDSYNDEEEEKVDNKLEKITIIGAVIIVIFIIGIIIAIVANDMGGKSKKDDTKPTATASTSNNEDGEYISDVTGKSREEAEAYLKQLGFTNVHIEEYDVPGEEEGLVFNQDPSPSSDIPYPYDTAITLYVQKSGAQKAEETEEKVTIPSSVKGMLPSEAISTIKGLFKNNAVTLKFEEVYMEDESGSVQEGQVFKTSPNIGEKISNTSTVKLFIHLKKKEAKVPNLIGMTIADARNELRKEGFILDESNIKENPDATNVAIGEICDQSPGAKSTANKRAKITVTIRTKKNEPTKEPEAISNNYKVTVRLIGMAIQNPWNDSEDSDDGDDGFPGNGHGNNKKDDRVAKVTAKLYVDGQEKGSKNGFITPDNYRAGLTFEFFVTGYNGNLQTSNIDVDYSVTDVDNTFERNSSNTEISIVKTN